MIEDNCSDEGMEMADMSCPAAEQIPGADESLIARRRPGYFPS